MQLDVVGAGLAGQIAALAAGAQGFSVRLWGRAEPAPARAVALSAPSVRYLSQFAPAVSELGAPITRIHVSRQSRWGRAELTASEFNLVEFGRVMSNDELSAVLYQTIQAERFDASVESLTPTSGGWEVNGLETGQVLLATGGAGLLKKVGIESSQPELSGQLWAGVGRSDEQTAYERFTDTGPLAILPMGQGRVSLVWHRSAHCEAEVRSQEIERAMGHRVRIASIEAQQSFPIRLHRAHSLVRPNLAVVGNASQFMHPVAGQGLNLILRQIQAWVKNVQDVPRYQACALADQAKWFKTTSVLAELFQPQWPAQGLALASLQALQPAKQAFVSQFMEGA